MVTKVTKRAFISGITKGIGKDLAIGLKKRGYIVYGTCAPNEQWEAHNLEEVYGVKIFAVDLTKARDIESFSRSIEQEIDGRLDFLFNNASIVLGGPAIEIPDDDVAQIFNVNVLGNIYLTKYLSNYVINAKGVIVFSSSATARLPIPWLSAYGASKAAIDQYALVLRSELKPFGVSVHSVVLGNVSPPSSNHGIVTNCLRGPNYDVDGIYDSFKSIGLYTETVNLSSREVAEDILNKLLSLWSFPGFNVYSGARAYISHLYIRYFPLWVVEYKIALQFYLFKVWAGIRRKKKQVHRE